MNDPTHAQPTEQSPDATPTEDQAKLAEFLKRDQEAIALPFGAQQRGRVICREAWTLGCHKARVDDGRPFEEIRKETLADLLLAAFGADLEAAVDQRNQSVTPAEYEEKQRIVLAEVRNTQLRINDFVASLIPADPPKVCRSW